MTADVSAALAAAARGWHVFPLRPDDKRPAFPDHSADRCDGRDARCRTTGGHVGWEGRATTDPDRIRRAWSTTAYGVGIACGPSCLVVVDLDRPKPDQAPPPEWATAGITDGADVFAALCESAGQPFPGGTYTVATGRGGTHLYFTHPGGAQLRNTAGTLGWLVDTRAHGGYVVAAGTTAAGLPYTILDNAPTLDLPGWLTTALRPKPLPPQRPIVVELGSGRRAAYLDAAITASLTAISDAPDGTLNRTLYGAAVALGQLVAGGALDANATEAVLLDAATRAGHPTGAALRTIASGFRAGTNRPRRIAA